MFDVTGYFVPGASGATYVPLTPARLLDSRVGNGLSGKFTANTPRSFQVSGRRRAGQRGGRHRQPDRHQPDRGRAAFLGPNPTASPSSSTLNFPLGDNRANGVTLALGAGAA